MDRWQLVDDNASHLSFQAEPEDNGHMETFGDYGQDRGDYRRPWKDHADADERKTLPTRHQQL